MLNTRLRNTKPIRRVSKKRAGQLRQYKKTREEFLKENPLCGVCKIKHADQIHHKRGRFGERLVEAEYFLGTCWECHAKIHQNPAWAYKNNFMLSR
jgi:hypothetical protein